MYVRRTSELSEHFKIPSKFQVSIFQNNKNNITQSCCLSVRSLKLLQCKFYIRSSIFASFDISLQMILVSGAPTFQHQFIMSQSQNGKHYKQKLVMKNVNFCIKKICVMITSIKRNICVFSIYNWDPSFIR